MYCTNHAEAKYNINVANCRNVSNFQFVKRIQVQRTFSCAEDDYKLQQTE